MTNTNRDRAAWVTYAGETLTGIGITRESRTVEACPDCGQPLTMVFASAKGTAWMRLECKDCGFAGEACPPVE